MNSLRDRDLDRERDLSDFQHRDYDRDQNWDQERDYDRSRDRGRVQDREISLGTGTILGIFFALALLCAVFFGFGYSMGRKSAQPTITSADPAPPTGFFGGAKPSPGSPLASLSKPASTASTPAPSTHSDADSQQTPLPSKTQPEEVSSYTPRQTPVSPRTPAALASENSVPVVVKPPTRPIAAATPPPAPETPMPQTSPNGTTMVQVAAVSHQEDADLLLSALKNRGYAVFIRQEAQDHLLHVQVGPFATRKDAEAMRQRLLSDGYNAIVK